MVPGEVHGIHPQALAPPQFIIVERMANIRYRHSEKAQWNAKLRLGGNFSNSQFLELDLQGECLERSAANHGHENKN